MNASKITVPANVATAIRHYTDLHETKHEAFANILQLGYEAEKSEAILRHFDGDYDLLMEALICGYEVEQTPEDEVRALYAEAKLMDGAQHSKHGTLYYSGAMYGIRKTLNFLGIKIVGVNA